MLEKELAQAFDKIQEKSSARNLIIGRLGEFDGAPEDIDVVGRPGYVVVSMGSNGDLGVTIAKDKAGVAKTVFQEVRMRREHGELVIREASEYAGGDGGGGSSTLDGLTDVVLFPVSNGEVLTYSSSLGQWTNLPSGGAGSTYSAGNGLQLTGSTFSVKPKPNEGIDADGSGTFVKRSSTGAIGSDNAGLFVVPKANGGLSTDASGLFIVPKANGGLNTDAGGVYIVTDPAGSLTTGAAGIAVVPRPNFGLFNNAAGLGILKPTTSGLVLDSSGLYIGQGDGIDVLATTIAIRRDTNSGMIFGGGGGLALGTPTSGSVSSTNSVTTTTHSHAVVTSSDVGTVPAQSILASNASGQLTLAQLTLRGNLLFAGADRSITASNNLTIAPTTDLILDPTGLIVLPNAQELRTATHNDFVAGIAGLRHWDTGGNVRMLTIGKVKADELHVRVFSSDEQRVSRAAEFWSRSFGIVQEGLPGEDWFVVPADEATVDVWFEEAAALGSAALFIPNNWLLFRTIDAATGLIVQAVWFEVVDGDAAGSNNYIQRQAASDTPPSHPSRQQWRLRRKSGGFTGEKIKKGNVGVEFGIPADHNTTTKPLYVGQFPGQGVVHLSALHEDGGPFVQIQTFETVTADVPQFVNRVRMGNLKGTVDYGANNVFGFAAGNDLSKTPSTGFVGLAAEATNGLRLFSTSLLLYQGSTLFTTLTPTSGLQILQDTSSGVETDRYITWFSSLGPPVVAIDRRGLVGNLLSGDISSNVFYAYGTPGDHRAQVVLSAFDGVPGGNPSGLALVSAGVGGPSAATVNASYIWLAGNTRIGSGSPYNADNVLIVHKDQAYSGGVGVPSMTQIQIRNDNAAGYTGLGFWHTTERGRIQYNNASPNIYLTTFGAIPLYFGTNDTIRLALTSAGNVGIGQSAASAANALVVWRDQSSVSVPTITQIQVRNDHANGFAAVSLWGAGAEKGRFQYNNGTPNIYMGSIPAIPFYLGTNDTVRLTVSPTGLVGIGTTAPGEDVIGATDYLPGKLLHIDSATNAGLLVSGDSGGAAINLIYGSGTADKRWFRITKQGTGTSFQHVADGGTGIGPRLTLGSATNEGIGFVGLPEAGTGLLIQADSIRGVVVENYATAQAHFLARRSLGSSSTPIALNSGNSILSLMAVGYHNGGAYHSVQNAEIAVRATENYTSSTTGGAEITFFTRNNGASTVTEKMKLQHNGALYIPFVWNTTGGTTAVKVAADGILYKDVSSIRHKTNVRDMPRVYEDDFVMAMRPVLYNLISGVDRGDKIGFIAEEIQAIAGGVGEPFIARDSDGRVESLHYDRLIGPAIGAIQRLITRTIELEQRLNALERKLAA